MRHSRYTRKKKSSGFMTFVVVMLAITMIAGFGYGYYLKKPTEKTDSSSDVWIFPDEKEDSVPTANTAEESEEPADEDNAQQEDSTAADEPSNYQSILASLLNTGKLPEDVKIESGGEEPQDVASAEPKKEPVRPPRDVEVQIVGFESDNGENDGQPEDVEQEMYTFQDATKPADLDEYAKKGDEAYEKAREQLAKWNESRSVQELKKAKTYLEKAQTYYQKSLQQKESEYVSQRLHLANQLLYLTIKSSSVSVRRGRR